MRDDARKTTSPRRKALVGAAIAITLAIALLTIPTVVDIMHGRSFDLPKTLTFGLVAGLVGVAAAMQIVTAKRIEREELEDSLREARLRDEKAADTDVDN